MSTTTQADPIPAELKARDQWVVWRQEARGGKPTKVLYQARHPDKKAKVNDPATWASHEEAVRAAGREGIAGIGYVFSEEDPYCGVDLDRCLREDGRDEEWARPFLAALGATYGEVSPSGRGVKFIARGRLDGGGKRRNGYGADKAGAVEIYDRGRFFTITGRIWDSQVGGIADLAPYLATLYSEVQQRPQLDESSTSPPATTIGRDGKATPYDRAAAYARKCDPAISGQGGHDRLFNVACKMVEFGITPGEALRILRTEYNPRCEPPWSDRELEHKVQDAFRENAGRAGAKLEEGRGGNGRPHVNGTAPHADTADPVPVEPPARTGAEIILDYFRERYRPAFRRGNAVVCEAGDTLTPAVACYTPTSDLIRRLEGASDAPLTDGRINRGRLPGFFRTWAPVAWGDLIASVPDEDTAELGADAPAGEEFRRLVREALLSEIVLGDIITGTGVTQVERRSLIDWCQRFGKTGPWRSIRSKKCWCKLRDLGEGEVELIVAIRHELFAQVGADRRLREMTANTFARRAQRYGVGTVGRGDRPHGQSAVVLASEFVRDLLANTPQDEDVAAEFGGA